MSGQLECMQTRWSDYNPTGELRLAPQNTDLAIRIWISSSCIFIAQLDNAHVHAPQPPCWRAEQSRHNNTPSTSGVFSVSFVLTIKGLQRLAIVWQKKSQLKISTLKKNDVAPFSWIIGFFSAACKLGQRETSVWRRKPSLSVGRSSCALKNVVNEFARRLIVRADSMWRVSQ